MCLSPPAPACIPAFSSGHLSFPSELLEYSRTRVPPSGQPWAWSGTRDVQRTTLVQHPGLILPRAQRSPKKRRLAHDAVDPGLRMLSVPSFSADNVAICLPSLNSALLEAAQMPQPGLQSRVD